MSRSTALAVLGLVVLAAACGRDRSSSRPWVIASAPPATQSLTVQTVVLGDSTVVARSGSVLRFTAEFENRALAVVSYDQELNDDVSAVLAAHGYDPWSAAAIMSGRDPDCLQELGARLEAEKVFAKNVSWGQIKAYYYCLAHPDDPRCKSQG
jgi:hypothetical protein